jgi:acyl-CoA dehydrogenase
VRVPVENLIGEENRGFLVIMTNFNSERMFMAAAMEALGRVCLEEAATWARERNTFGKRLADHQVIRHKFAQMKQKLNATQAYIRVCYESIENGNPNPGDIALLKVQASETMEFAPARRCRFSAVSATCAATAVERIYREVRVNAIGGGSEEIMRDLAARQYGL